MRGEHSRRGGVRLGQRVRQVAQANVEQPGRRLVRAEPQRGLGQGCLARRRDHAAAERTPPQLLTTAPAEGGQHPSGQQGCRGQFGGVDRAVPAQAGTGHGRSGAMRAGDAARRAGPASARRGRTVPPGGRGCHPVPRDGARSGLGRAARCGAGSGLGRGGTIPGAYPATRCGGVAGRVLVAGRPGRGRLGGDHLDAGAMRIPGHAQDPAGADQAGDGEPGPVRLDPAGVQLEDLPVAPAIPEMVLRDLPHALVVTADRGLHHVDLLDQRLLG